MVDPENQDDYDNIHSQFMKEACGSLGISRMGTSVEDIAREVWSKIDGGVLERLNDPEALIGFVCTQVNSHVKTHRVLFRNDTFNVHDLRMDGRFNWEDFEHNFLAAWRVSVFKQIGLSIRDRLRDLVLTPALTHMKGPDGYLAVSEMFYRGVMQRTRAAIAIALGGTGIGVKSLGWGATFYGQSSEYREALDEIDSNWSKWCSGDCEKRDHYDSLPDNLCGIWGYVAYAETRCGGDMKRAYKNMSSICTVSGKKIKVLDWGPTFYGTTTEFRERLKEVEEMWDLWTKGKSAMRPSYTTLPQRLKGVGGKIAYAIFRCDDDLRAASNNMASLCRAAGEDFRVLEWGESEGGKASTRLAELIEARKAARLNSEEPVEHRKIRSLEELEKWRIDPNAKRAKYHALFGDQMIIFERELSPVRYAEERTALKPEPHEVLVILPTGRVTKISRDLLVTQAKFDESMRWLAFDDQWDD